MNEPTFPDKRCRPQDADLARALGRTKRHWDDLAACAAASPEAKPEWKHYGKNSGWVFVVRGKRRNLMYLMPHDKWFGANFAFGEEAVQAALDADLPAAVIELIRQAPIYPEGRAVRLQVRSAADAKVAKELLKIKLGG